MERIAQALEFPQWFGGNWDALEDCLTDLSWSKAAGHVLLFEGAGGLAARRARHPGRHPRLGGRFVGGAQAAVLRRVRGRRRRRCPSSTSPAA